MAAIASDLSDPNDLPNLPRSAKIFWVSYLPRVWCSLREEQLVRIASLCREHGVGDNDL